MRIGFWAFAGWLMVAIVSQQAQSAEPVFGRTTVHSLHVMLSEENYTKMDPPPRALFGGPGAPGSNRQAPGGPPSNRPAPGSPDFGAGNFGFEFPYVPATIEINGQQLENVGLRYKGSGTYMMSQRHVKRSLKLDFDRYDQEQTWQGIKKLNLNSGVMDPSKSREALAYAVFHSAGLPASRTSFAKVTLTVPGQHDQEPLGLFTVVEQVNKPFLRTHFNRSDGLLLKPEGIRGLPHFGDDPEAYKETYNPKEKGRPEDWQRLVELTRLINLADEQEFHDHIDDYLDIDAFATFVAVNTALASMDSFLGLGHNYYLYLSPDTNKFVFFPWDLDLAFGAFPMYGRPEQMADLSIEHPHVGENKLIDRLLTMPEWKALYRQKLQQISESILTPDVLGQQLAKIEATIETLRTEDRAAAERRGERTGGPFGAMSVELSEFIAQRKRSIDNQLAGKSKGYIPTQGFGPGGFGGFGPPPGGPPIAPQLLSALDTNGDRLLSQEELVKGMKLLATDWDTNQDGQLSEQELAEGLQKLSPRSRQ